MLFLEKQLHHWMLSNIRPSSTGRNQSSVEAFITSLISEVEEDGPSLSSQEADLDQPHKELLESPTTDLFTPPSIEVNMFLLDNSTHQHYSPDCNIWSSITEEDFISDSIIHDVYNLHDRTPLLSVSGFKI